MDLLTAAENLPFTVAIAVMMGLTVLEGASLLLGGGLSDWLDGLIPESLVAPDYDGPLGWLHLGKVPLMMIIILFLSSFGLSGLVLQMLLHGISGHYLPGLLASVPAFLTALPIVRVGGSLLGQLMPRDESTAISENDLLGRVATITLGVAQQGQAAQARLTDQHGQTHYVMVEPEENGIRFPSGTQVLLVKRLAHHYHAILNPHPELL